MDPIQSQPLSPLSTPQQKGFLQRYKFTLLSLLVILVAAVPLLLLSNSASKSKIPQQVTATPSPTTQPLTSSNADETLNQASTDLDSSLNQADTDLQTQAQVDSSQDSTAGL